MLIKKKNESPGTDNIFIMFWIKLTSNKFYFEANKYKQMTQVLNIDKKKFAKIDIWRLGKRTFPGF